MEQSKSEKAQDKCAGNLEDTLLASETDKQVALANVVKAIERIKLSINPCGFFGKIFRRNDCRVSRTETQK